jgi:hypothetical protein
MSLHSTEVIVQNTPLPVDGSGVTQPVSGSVSVSNFPAVQPVSDNGASLTVDGAVSVTGSVAVTGPLTDTELRATPVPVSGTVAVSNFPGGSTALATVTQVSVGTSPVTVSVSNAAKVRVIIYNETGTLFVKLGTGASASSYSYRLTANSLTEIDTYTGAISAVKASGTTNVLVTEVGI